MCNDHEVYKTREQAIMFNSKEIKLIVIISTTINILDIASYHA